MNDVQLQLTSVKQQRTNNEAGPKRLEHNSENWNSRRVSILAASARHWRITEPLIRQQMLLTTQRPKAQPYITHIPGKLGYIFT